MHRQYKLNQQAAQTDPLMTGLSLSAQGHVRLSPLISVTAHLTAHPSDSKTNRDYYRGGTTRYFRRTPKRVAAQR